MRSIASSPRRFGGGAPARASLYARRWNDISMIPGRSGAVPFSIWREISGKKSLDAAAEASALEAMVPVPTGDGLPSAPVHDGAEGRRVDGQDGVGRPPPAESTPERVWEALTDPDLTEQYWTRRNEADSWEVGSRWTHVRPDGDGLGSMLALADALRSLGKQPKLVIPSGLPARYRFLDPEGTIERFAPPGEAWNDAEVIVVGAGPAGSTSATGRGTEARRASWATSRPAPRAVQAVRPTGRSAGWGRKSATRR